MTPETSVITQREQAECEWMASLMGGQDKQSSTLAYEMSLCATRLLSLF